MKDAAELLNAIHFAAKKHIRQRRKGANSEAYINHPIEVSKLIADIAMVSDLSILIAAILHDTIEDTDTTSEEITELFGETVCAYVLEVSDDKSLDKNERKLLQIEHAPHLSDGAALIKIADKISNIGDMSNNPPENWTNERRFEYVEWAENVVAGARGQNVDLDALFDQVAEKAKKEIVRKSS